MSADATLYAFYCLPFRLFMMRTERRFIMAKEKTCKWCLGTGHAWSTYIKAYVVCDACKGSGKA